MSVKTDRSAQRLHLGCGEGLVSLIKGRPHDLPRTRVWFDDATARAILATTLARGGKGPGEAGRR